MADNTGLRREERTEKSSPVQLIWKDRGGTDRYVSGKSLDISPSGMRIEIGEAIDKQTYVTITCMGLAVQGSASVRSCTRKGMKFIVGLEFSGWAWKPKTKEV